MRIREATNLDILPILGLTSELEEHMESIYLKERKRLKIKKGIFYRRSGKLSIQGKALLFIIVGKYLDSKKQKFNLNKLQKIFHEYCKWWFIKITNFLKIVKELQDYGFIELKNNEIYLKVPYEEAYPIRSHLRKILYVKNLNKKYKLEKGKIYFIHLIAEEKGKIIGYLSGFLIKYRVGGDGELSELVVSSKERGKGVGSKLVKEFLKIAENKGVDCVQVTTSKENKKAIKFYQRHGFKKSKEVYLYWQPYKW